MGKIDPVTLFEGLCPFCGSDKTRVSKTKKPTRVNYCQDCNKQWYSLTINQLCDDALQIVADIQRQKRELDRGYPFLEF